MAFKASKEVSHALPLYTKQSADNTKVLVFAGVGNIWRIYIENPHTAATYIQMFDAASTGAVTLGTTVADFSLLIPPGSSVQLNVADLIPLKNFQNGLVYAVTSTRTGATAPGANANVNIWYAN